MESKEVCAVTVHPVIADGKVTLIIDRGTQPTVTIRLAIVQAEHLAADIQATIAEGKDADRTVSRIDTALAKNTA